MVAGSSSRAGGSPSKKRAIAKPSRPRTESNDHARYRKKLQANQQPRINGKFVRGQTEPFWVVTPTFSKCTCTRVAAPWRFASVACELAVAQKPKCQTHLGSAPSIRLSTTIIIIIAFANRPRCHCHIMSGAHLSGDDDDDDVVDMEATSHRRRTRMRMHTHRPSPQGHDDRNDMCAVPSLSSPTPQRTIQIAAEASAILGCDAWRIILRRYR